jgi:hypothetical protein
MKLPAFTEYSMKGRTYRYYKGTPLYEFGFGLSYTNFTYTNLTTKAILNAGEALTVTVDVQNTAAMTVKKWRNSILLKKGKCFHHASFTERFFKDILKKGREEESFFFIAAKRLFAYRWWQESDRGRSFSGSRSGKQPTNFSKGKVLIREVK